MITRDNITMHELIGMNTEISSSSNPQVIGLNGKIVDETKSMITLSTAKGMKSIPKSNNEWKFTVEGKEIIVNGSRIAKRSSDRLGARA
ncbi:MAG: ribonuclease P protein subunit [Nitrosarchaeum sp.]|nr:ribonuclease P protein subunit [Nitrosarchaeum sp.]MCV0398968.1 ribonuclease P protein subunit [Nitrosarchaeum sp.]